MTLMARNWVTDPWCLNGWAGCRESYTRGHYCERDYQHKGRCKCICGATTTTTPPLVTEDVR